jgi:hypothetical protein
MSATEKRAVGALVVLNNSQSSPLAKPSEFHPEIAYVLAEFADVFEEPNTLPPKRSIHHTIPLL